VTAQLDIALLRGKLGDSGDAILSVGLEEQDAVRVVLAGLREGLAEDVADLCRVLRHRVHNSVIFVYEVVSLVQVDK
jgi:hypothetical protein